MPTSAHLNLWRNTNREILNNEIVRKGKLTEDADINDPLIPSILKMICPKTNFDFIDRIEIKVLSLLRFI